MNSTDHIIRESLRYVHRFRDEIVVVKLGHTIIESAERLGIIRDICAVKKAGINIVIAHSSNDFSVKEWEGLECIFCGFNHDIPVGTQCADVVPVFQCPSFGDDSIDMNVAKAAVDMGARKLIFITNRTGVFNFSGNLISEISIGCANKLIKDGVIKGGMMKKVSAAIFACENGVKRVHIISGQEGSLLLEIFSCEGFGTMIYDFVPYKLVRKARESDIEAIARLIGARFSVSRIQIKNELIFYRVFEIDKEIMGCVRIKPFKTNQMVIEFLSCAKYCDQSVVLNSILDSLIKNCDSKRMVIDLSRNSVWIAIYPWFKKMGWQNAGKKKGIYFYEALR